MKKNPKRAIILCSGGLDSVTALYYVKKKLNYGEIIVLFFNYSQKSLKREKRFSKLAADNVGAEFMELSLGELGKISTSLINKPGWTLDFSKKDISSTKSESGKFYVPCRNTIFLSYALALAEALYNRRKGPSDIFVGFKSEGKEPFPDATPLFLEKINSLARVSCAFPFKIRAPFIRKDKEDLIQIGEKLEVDFTKTFSCYVSDKKHCGLCLACRLRKEGFYWAGLPDPTKYSKRL